MMKQTYTFLLMGFLVATLTAARADLVGYWTFDGDNCNDSSGNSYHGTMNGGSYTNDVPAALSGGKSAYLAAGDHYVIIDSIAHGAAVDPFDLGASGTVSCWIKGWPDGSWEPFVCKNGEPNGWQLRRSGGSLQVNWTTRGAGASNGDLAGAADASSGGWRHIVGTFDGTYKKIYIDGVLDTVEKTTGGSITPSNDRVVFGARERDSAGNMQSWSRMQVDDVAIYNEVLSAGQVAHLAAGNSPQALPGGDEIYYDFEDSTLQGWQNVLKSSMAGGFTQFGNTNATPHWGSRYVRGEPWAGTSYDNEAQPIMLRSPRFRLTHAADITAWLYAGNGIGTGTTGHPGHDSSWPAGSDNVNGRLRLCLRRCSDGAYVLSTGKSADGGSWERVTISSNAVAPYAGTDALYTLDLVDQQHGGWGWFAMDDVIIPGEEVSTPTEYKIQFDCGDDQGWYLGTKAPAHHLNDFHPSERTWNMMEGDVSSDLLWADGTPASGLEVDVGASAGGGGAINRGTRLNIANYGAGTGHPYDAFLMRDWFYTSGDADMGWRVKGLPAGTYRVYALVREPNQLARTYDVDIGANLTTKTASAQSVTDASGLSDWYAGKNYVTAEVTISGTSDYITIIVDPTGSGQWATLEGVQIMKLFDDSDFNYRMQIDLDGYTGTETLTNFPVLVKLTDGQDGFYGLTTLSGGTDLRFVWSNGLDELSYEIEEWNPGGTSYVWVRVPAVTSSGYIWAYWGNASLTEAPAYTMDGSTWLGGFEGVWHMNESSASSAAVDGSSSANHGTATASPTVETGLISGARGMTGSHKFTVGSALDLSNKAFTLSSWAYRTHSGGDVMWFGGGTGSGSSGMHCGFRGTQIWYGLYGNDGNCPTDYSGDINNWHYYTWVMEANQLKRIYRDGVAVPTGGTSNNLYQSTGLAIGATYGGGTSYQGSLDELRASPGVARSADWIYATYLNMASNDVFQTYNATEALNTYTITVAQASGGVISEDTHEVGPMLNSSNMTITASNGYYLAEVLIDGVSITPTDHYQFTTVVANHSISATFLALPTHLITNDMALWLDAESMVSLSDDDPVATWYDLSGNGRDATQGTAANQPLFKTGVQNGKPVMRLDGGNDVFNFDGTFLANSDYTIFIVEARNDTAVNYLFGKTTGGPSNGHLHLGYRDNTTFTHAHWGNDYNMGVSGFSTKAFKMHSWHLDSAGGSGRQTYTDGNLLGSNTGTGQLTEYNSALLGGRTSDMFNGDIAEVIIYDSYLNGQERNQVGWYLAQKYGLTAGYTDPTHADIAVSVAADAFFYYT